MAPATIDRADATYEVHFASPAFDLPGRPADVLGSFYRTLTPRFPLSLADLRASEGTSMDSVSAEVSIFNGDAVIEVTLAKCAIKLRQLRSHDASVLCTDIVVLSCDALKKAFPKTSVDAVTLHSVLILDVDETVNACNLLSDYDTATNMDLPALPGVRCFPSASFAAESAEKDWAAFFRAYPNTKRSSSLVAQCDVKYTADQAIKDPRETVANFKSLFKAFLRGVGIDASGSMWKELQ